METLIEREAERLPTEKPVTCRLYASSDAFYPMRGVLRNCSARGAYIESEHAFKSGAVLLLKIESVPAAADADCCVEEGDPQPNSCLMEVRSSTFRSMTDWQ